MKRNLFAQCATLCRAEFLSAKDFVRHAILITLLYLIADLAGLRDFTSVLNGTMGSVKLGQQISGLLGVTYILLYLAFVLLVPILLIASGLAVLWNRFSQGKKSHSFSTR